MRDTSIPAAEATPTYEHLNCLLGYRWLGWVTRTANKDHVDQFGLPIKAGDLYYALDHGVANVDRLSQASMDALLKIVFRKPSVWLEKVELLVRKGEQEMFDQLNGIR